MFRFLTTFLGEDYQFEYTEETDAPYVFCSCFGNSVTKYSGVRIFICGENVYPDFNLHDYAVTFFPITFGQRYLQLPLIRFYEQAYQSLLREKAYTKEHIEGKKFCSYVMSNTKNSAPIREELFHQLSTYQQVDSGGRWNNNVGGPVEDKIAFQSGYKFVIACENSSTPGYLTEKFADAALSGAIPIYWGDPEVTRFINPDSFINVNDYDSLESLVQRVAALDRDDAAYLQMLNTPYFIDRQEPEIFQEETIKNFFRNIFEAPPQPVRNTSRWGQKYEKRLHRAIHKPWSQLFAKK